MAQHDDMWAKAAADCGFTVHENLPHIGISGDSGDGFIVPVPAPAWFGQIRDEGARKNVFRAMAAHALRVGQGKVKAAETPTRQIAADGVASAIVGTYEPGRSVDNDIAGTEAAKMFRVLVTDKVKAAKPDATEAEIDETIKAQAATERGKALLADFNKTVLERGTYAVNRRKGGGKATAITLEL